MANGWSVSRSSDSSMSIQDSGTWLTLCSATLVTNEDVSRVWSGPPRHEPTCCNKKGGEKLFQLRSPGILAIPPMFSRRLVEAVTPPHTEAPTNPLRRPRSSRAFLQQVKKPAPPERADLPPCATQTFLDSGQAVGPPCPQRRKGCLTRARLLEVSPRVDRRSPNTLVRTGVNSHTFCVSGTGLILSKRFRCCLPLGFDERVRYPKVSHGSSHPARWVSPSRADASVLVQVRSGS